MRNRKKLRLPNGEQGFSLLEIIIVLAIIGTIAGLIISNVVKNREQANLQLSATKAQNLQAKLVQFQLSHEGKYPTTEEGLAILTKPGVGGETLADPVDLQDAWSHPFDYRLTPKGPIIISGGKDGNTAGPTAICYAEGRAVDCTVLGNS